MAENSSIDYNLQIAVDVASSSPEVLMAVDGDEAAELSMSVDVGADVSAEIAEKWAVGTVGGVEVPSTDPTYHNNSKYWAQLIGADVDAIEAAAELAEDVAEQLEEISCFMVETGVISSLPKTITDSRITVQHVVLDMIPDENVDIGWVCQPGKIILYGTLPTGTTIPSQKLRVLKCIGETEDAVTLTLREQTSSSDNGNYLVAEAGNLIPGVQYTFRIYSVAGGTDTYVYGVGTTVHYPTHSMWFQEVPRGLVAGTVYKCTVAPTTGSSAAVASNTVTFVGGAVTPETEETVEPVEPEET